MGQFRFGLIKKIKPHPQSVEARLPDVYKKYLAALKSPSAPVHYIPEAVKWKLDPVTKQKTRVENRDIPLDFPKEADEGIWGGEGVVRGFIKEKVIRRRYPNYWVPKLKKAIVYSEILNQYMEVIVTERTLRLIDENYGFDHYILSTPVQDLKSQLALSIRRKMLLALLNGEKYHENEELSKEVFEKYKKYMIQFTFHEQVVPSIYETDTKQKEEAEWFGLTLREAVQKQKLIEEEQKLNAPPLKHQLRLKLIEEFKRMQEEKESENENMDSSYASWLSKLNPFISKKEKEE